LEKNIKKKGKKIILKNFRFLDFSGKTDFGPPDGRVNIMADDNFLATNLKMSLDYEFDIKNNI
jgi:hypothetical protein